MCDYNIFAGDEKLNSIKKKEVSGIYFFKLIQHILSLQCTHCIDLIGLAYDPHSSLFCCWKMPTKLDKRIAKNKYFARAIPTSIKGRGPEKPYGVGVPRGPSQGVGREGHRGRGLEKP